MPEPVEPPDDPMALAAEAVDGPKLLRVQASLFSIVSELRLMAEQQTEPDDSDRSRRRLAALEQRLLIELGSALPDPLLEELRRDVGARPVEGASEGELRVVAAQLLGWAEGLLAALAVAPPDERPDR